MRVNQCWMNGSIQDHDTNKNSDTGNNADTASTCMPGVFKCSKVKGAMSRSIHKITAGMTANKEIYKS